MSCKTTHHACDCTLEALKQKDADLAAAKCEIARLSGENDAWIITAGKFRQDAENGAKQISELQATVAMLRKALEVVADKNPRTVSRTEAANLAVEFYNYARGTLKKVEK